MLYRTLYRRKMPGRAAPELARYAFRTRAAPTPTSTTPAATLIALATFDVRNLFPARPVRAMVATARMSRVSGQRERGHVHEGREEVEIEKDRFLVAPRNEQSGQEAAARPRCRLAVRGNRLLGVTGFSYSTFFERPGAHLAAAHIAGDQHTAKRAGRARQGEGRRTISPLPCVNR